jgi:hypothetical protein
MSRMAKDRGVSQNGHASERRQRAVGRGATSASGDERSGGNRDAHFVQAFADALRDILVHERRRAA